MDGKGDLIRLAGQVPISRGALSQFHIVQNSFLATKGQIISKGLVDVLELSQKTNEGICPSSKKEFFGSFWENLRIPKVLLKLSDLYNQFVWLSS